MNFNLDQYANLLSAFQEVGHKFIDFNETENSSTNSILLRHDIDADLTAALRMARLEADLGIKATYFLMLRSPLYNLMGRENFGMACEIVKLGHAVGLHYDQGFDTKRRWSHEETQAGIESEALWLESQLGVKIAAVSFHQPGLAVLQNEIVTKALINTYDKTRLAEYQYFSDSNRCFPFVNIVNSTHEDIYQSLPKKFQLLIHPLWWVYDDKGTSQVWNQAILANFDVMQRQLIDTERAYGHERKIVLI